MLGPLVKSHLPVQSDFLHITPASWFTEAPHIWASGGKYGGSSAVTMKLVYSFASVMVTLNPVGIILTVLKIIQDDSLMIMAMNPVLAGRLQQFLFLSALFNPPMRSSHRIHFKDTVNACALMMSHKVLRCKVT